MKVQILDYSTHQGAATLFKRYIPDDIEVSTHYIYSEDSIAKACEETGITHVIHSGSSLSINEQHPFSDLALDNIHRLKDQRISQLGVCFGHQLLCRALVGQQAIQASPNGFEAGWCDVVFVDGATPIPGLSGVEVMWQHHFDEVTELPADSELIATATHSPIQAWLNSSLRVMGMQFHPEFDRDSGNAYFLNDRALLQQHDMDADALTQSGPSGKHGESIFNYFLNQF